jgi:hypothetical protein
MATGISEPLKQIARDLMNLEVNTIIKANMTGRKMPKPRHALVDIAQNYQRKLMQLGLWAEDDAALMGSFNSFNQIRESAGKGIKAFREQRKNGPLTEAEELDLVMLFRIQKMSDQIKGVFNALRERKAPAWENDMSRDDIESSHHPPMPLSTDELVLIRKIWEMGLEQIALQTIIQLDGDVLTRIQPRYAAENEMSRTIQSIHSQNVTISLRFWEQLISVLQAFFAGLTKALR